MKWQGHEEGKSTERLAIYVGFIWEKEEYNTKKDLEERNLWDLMQSDREEPTLKQILFGQGLFLK